MKKICLFLLMFAVSGMVLAAENGGDMFRRERGMRQGRRENNMRGGAFYGRIIAEEKIATAFPEKYAALEAAREKYEQELAALAKEANVELPAQRDDALRQIRKKFPAEFSAVIKEISASPREAMGKLMKLAEKAGVKLFPGNIGRGSRNGFGREKGQENNFARKFDRPDMAKLRSKYPEQMREYDSLRRTDPGAARRKLLEVIALEQGGKK